MRDLRNIPDRLGLICVMVLALAYVDSPTMAGGLISTSKSSTNSTEQPPASANPTRSPTAIATPPPADALRGPVHAFSWNRVTRDCVNITPMMWVTSRSDPRYVAYLSRSRPPGRAVYMVDALVESLLYHPQDAPRTLDGELTTYFTPWPTQGIETVKNNMTTFFSALAEHRGRADWIVMDNENYVSSWSLSRDHLLAIQNDPRSVELKQQLGFDNFTSIYSYRISPNYITWNAVLHKMVVNAINTAAFEPVQQLFPDVKGANYKSYILTPEEVVPGPNGHLQYYQAHVGTHNSTSF